MKHLTFLLGISLLLGGFTAEASAQTAPALVKEAQGLLESGKPDEALAKADAAIAADGKLGEAYFWRGKIRAGKQNDKGALEDLNKALELGYSTGELYRFKAMSEHLTGNDAEGCKSFAKAIELGDALSGDFKTRFCK